MEDFIAFDPGIEPDLIPDKIKRVTTINVVLTVCMVAAVIAAGYYAYWYYELRDEFD
ncbi:MAG: hypothetical protein HQ521_04175 [Bacteroidetes bacterium]|nr:hypothetical protein [Bacteroidota bacterium]